MQVEEIAQSKYVFDRVAPLRAVCVLGENPTATRPVNSEQQQQKRYRSTTSRSFFHPTEIIASADRKSE